MSANWIDPYDGAPHPDKPDPRDVDDRCDCDDGRDHFDPALEAGPPEIHHVNPDALDELVEQVRAARARGLGRRFNKRRD